MRVEKRPSSFSGINESLLQTTNKYGTLVTVLIMSLLCVGIGLMVYLYVLSSWFESNRAYREQVSKKELENLKTERMIEGEGEFQVKFNKIDSLYQQAKPLLPEETEVSEVLGQVEMAAQKNGVILTGLSAVKESVQSPKAAQLYEREIPALVTGPYPQVIRFFSDVSQMERILVVRDYSIVSLKSTVSAGFTLVAYHAPPPGQKPAAPPPAGNAPNPGGTK